MPFAPNGGANYFQETGTSSTLEPKGIVISMKNSDVTPIQSFQVDHTLLAEGIYISRKDGDIITYDLRTRRPNCGDYMDNETMHTFEHMFATYVRNSEISDEVIYFGPMGCQTGFYLLVRDSVSPQRVRDITAGILKKIIAHEGDVFGNSEIECGNYRTLKLSAATSEARRYLSVLENDPTPSFEYRKA